MQCHMTSPTFCIQPCEDVVCVVREEPPIVQHGGEHLSHCHDTRGGGGGEGRGEGRGQCNSTGTGVLVH